ncbi:hypothetical protein GGX14DRAFT_388422, partial [Mycena pura]
MPHSDLTSPFGDRTNTLQDQLDAKNAEIEQLESLVATFTKRQNKQKRKKTNRKKHDHHTSDADDNDNDTDKEDATPAKKTKVDACDYSQVGRNIGRLLGMFVNVHAVVEYGVNKDTALSGDEDDEDFNPRFAEEYRILNKNIAGFHEKILKSKSMLRRGISKLISEGIGDVRSDDTATLKRLIPDLVTINPSTPLDPPLADKKSKAHRGFAHPVFAALLTPIDWHANQ